MRRTAIAVLAVIAFGALAAPNAQSKRFITEKDLFKFTWIADPQISPDGSTVAFVRVVVNEKDNRYETSLFVVPTASQSSGANNATPRRVTAGIHDTSPRWAPDGKQLAFVRAPASQSSGANNAGKTQPAQIYVLRMDGGEAHALTDVASGASNPVWSPDGRTIAFNSETSADDVRKSDDPKPAAGHQSDVKVITQAVYRANGNPTYVDTEHHAHIFTIAVPDDGARVATPKQITDGEFDINGGIGGDQAAPRGQNRKPIVWSPDPSTLRQAQGRRLGR